MNNILVCGDELMLITSEGIIIRMTVDGISILKRITSGVKLVQLGENTQVASCARIKAEMIEESEEEGLAEGEEEGFAEDEPEGIAEGGPEEEPVQDE